MTEWDLTKVGFCQASVRKGEGGMDIEGGSKGVHLKRSGRWWVQSPCLSWKMVQPAG